jgi:hypothetical protein
MLFVDWSAWLCFIAAMLALLGFVIVCTRVGSRERGWKLGFRLLAGILSVTVGLVLACICLLTAFGIAPDTHGDPIYSPSRSRAARPTNWGYVFAGGTAVDLFSWRGFLKQRVFQANEGYYEMLRITWTSDHSLLIEYPKEIGTPICVSNTKIRVECRDTDALPVLDSPQTRTGSSSRTGEPKAWR